MDVSTILAGLKHPNYNARYSAISSLRSSVKDNKGQLTATTINKIFHCLSLLLLDENWSVIQATILLLGELSPEIVDLPMYIPVVLPNLVTNLGNPKGVIRRSTLSTLVIFVKQLYSAELVLHNLISAGFVHHDGRVRQGSILVIPQIIGPNTNGVDLKLLLKSLIFRLMDENPDVIMAAQQSIAYLSKIRKKHFAKMQHELDHDSFTVLTQHHHDIHNALLQQFQDSISYEEIQRFSNVHFKSNGGTGSSGTMVLFQIISPHILSELLHCTRRHDWNNATSTAQEILAATSKWCEDHRSLRVNPAKKSNDLKQLVLFLCRFLEIDSPVVSDRESIPKDADLNDGAVPLQNSKRSKSTGNPKGNSNGNSNGNPAGNGTANPKGCDRSRFVLVFLKMLEVLIHFDRNTLMNLAPYYIPRLVDLMQTSPHSMIGKKSLDIAKRLYLESSASNSGVIIQAFSDVLQQTLDIVREPLVTNMITLLLHHDRIQSSSLVDFQIVINNLSKVLNQAKSRLAYLIMECLAVMHHKLGLSLLTMLQNSTINANDMNALRERFKVKKLPILTKDGNLTFRHKNKSKNDNLFHHSVGSSGHIGYSKLSNLSNQSQSNISNIPSSTPTTLDSMHSNQTNLDGQDSNRKLHEKRHSKPSRNPSASRKIPFLSQLHHDRSFSAQNTPSNGSVGPLHGDGPGSPNSMRSEPLLQRRSSGGYSDGLHIDTHRSSRRAHDSGPATSHKVFAIQSVQSAPSTMIGGTNLSNHHNPPRGANNMNNGGGGGVASASFNGVSSSIPQRTHSAPQHHRHAAIAGHLSLLKKRKTRATSAHSSNISSMGIQNQSLSMASNRAKSFTNLHQVNGSQNGQSDYADILELENEITAISKGANTNKSNASNNSSGSSASQHGNGTNPGGGSSSSYSQQYAYRQQRYGNRSPSVRHHSLKTAQQVIGLPHRNRNDGTNTNHNHHGNNHHDRRPIRRADRKPRHNSANPIRITAQKQPNRRRASAGNRHRINGNNPSSNGAAIGGNGAYPMESGSGGNGAAMSRSSSLPTDTAYVPSEQLTAVPNPERAIKSALKQIQSKQWDERFNALNTIRKLGYHHKEVLAPNLLELCRSIGVEINSLRSSLSRIAIITVTDLFVCFGRKMESNKCIDLLLPNLMRRAGEMSNEFISSAADKAIYKMIDNISTQRSLTILLSHSKSKSPPIRSKVAMYLEKVVSVAGTSIFQHRDYERLIRAIGTFLNDPAVNTRNYTKRIIIRLNELQQSAGTKHSSDFDRKLKQFLSLQQYTKVQTVLAHSHEIQLHGTNSSRMMSPKFKKPLLRSSVLNGNGALTDSVCSVNARDDVMARSITIKNRPSASSSSSNHSVAASSSSMRDSGGGGGNEAERELIGQQFDAAFSSLNSSDWKQRIKGLAEIGELSESAQHHTATHIVAVMDRVAEAVTDSNAKVSVAAINRVRSMMQQHYLRPMMPKILSVVSDPLCTNLAAANPSIRKNCDEAINEMMVIADPVDVVQNIAQIVTFSNSRIKSHCLPKLTDAVFKMKMQHNNGGGGGRGSQSRNKSVQQMLVHHVIPSIQSTLSISKGSTQSDLRKLVRIVHSILGQKQMFQCPHIKNLRKDQLLKLQNMLNR